MMRPLWEGERSIPLPLANGLIGHHDPTFTEKLFHIPEAQTEQKGQPDGVANNLYRKAGILIAIVWR
jgi:hypothetical protein